MQFNIKTLTKFLTLYLHAYTLFSVAPSLAAFCWCIRLSMYDCDNSFIICFCVTSPITLLSHKCIWMSHLLRNYIDQHQFKLYIYIGMWLDFSKLYLFEDWAICWDQRTCWGWKFGLTPLQVLKQLMLLKWFRKPCLNLGPHFSGSWNIPTWVS